MDILLYDDFIHHTQINLWPNRQFLSIQQCAYKSFSSYYSYSTTMYEKEIRTSIHTEVMSHEDLPCLFSRQIS